MIFQQIYIQLAKRLKPKRYSSYKVIDKILNTPDSSKYDGNSKTDETTFLRFANHSNDRVSNSFSTNSVVWNWSTVRLSSIVMQISHVKNCHPPTTLHIYGDRTPPTGRMFFNRTMSNDRPKFCRSQSADRRNILQLPKKNVHKMRNYAQQSPAIVTNDVLPPLEVLMWL